MYIKSTISFKKVELSRVCWSLIFLHNKMIDPNQIHQHEYMSMKSASMHQVFAISNTTRRWLLFKIFLESPPSHIIVLKGNTTLNIVFMSLTIWSRTMLFFTINVNIYQVKMLMFHNVQITNLTFVDQKMRKKKVIALCSSKL